MFTLVQMKHLGILTNFQRFVCLPAQPTCLSFLLAREPVGASFRKLQLLCYSFPCWGELRFEIKSLPASSVRYSFGKMHFSCNNPEPMGSAVHQLRLEYHYESGISILFIRSQNWQCCQPEYKRFVTRGRVAMIFSLVTPPCCLFLLHLSLL